MIRLNTIHHVAIIVSDYQKSRDFYVNKLGFEIIRENYREQRGDYKLDLKLGDCELEIFGIPGSPARLNYPEACGLRHLAFKVDSMEEAVEALNAAGWTNLRIKDDIFQRSRRTAPGAA